FELRVDVRTGAHESRRNGCDEYFVAVQFGADGVGKSSERKFAGGVGGHVRNGDSSTDGRDVNDAPAAFGAHLRHDQELQNVRRPEMQPHRAVEIFQLHVRQGTDLDNPGIINEDVDLAEVLEGLLNGRLHLGGLEQVALDCKHF